MIVFYVLDMKAGFETFLHEQFNFICILSVITNIVIIILTHHTILKTPIQTFLSFNLGILLISSIILITGSRHGYFRHK